MIPTPDNRTTIPADAALDAVEWPDREPMSGFGAMLFGMGASMMAIQAENARLLREDAAFWAEVEKGKALDRAGCTWTNYEDKSEQETKEDDDNDERT